MNSDFATTQAGDSPVVTYEVAAKQGDPKALRMDTWNQSGGDWKIASHGNFSDPSAPPAKP